MNDEQRAETDPGTVDPEAPAPEVTAPESGEAPAADAEPAERPWILESDADNPLDRPDDAKGHAEKVEQWRAKSEERRSEKKRPWWVEIPIILVSAFILTFLIQTFVAKVYYVPSGSMETTLHGVQSGGDRILVNKIVYDFRDPRPGDIVVFKGNDRWAPELVGVGGATTWYGKVFESLGSVVGIAPPDEKDFVKRVIAVGGQTVQCCDEQGNIMVNGVSLNEHYVNNPLPFNAGDPTNDCTVSPDGFSFSSRRCFGPITIPEGQIFVMGDNRSFSADSAYQCYGQTEAAMNRTGDEGGPPSCVRLVAVDEVIGKAVFIVMPPGRWGTLGDPGIDVGGGGG